MVSPATQRITLPSSVIAIEPPGDETAPILPKLRIQVIPNGLLINSPSSSPRLDSKAIANALKVVVPLNGAVHIKIRLELHGLGTDQPLGLREEVLRVLEGCLHDNAGKLGIERITRCPEPRASAPDEEDVDLHYSTLPRAALPEHHWFKEHMLAAGEPVVQLTEIRLHISWARARSGGATSATNGLSTSTLAYVEGRGLHTRLVHQQVRSGMRRVLRLQFIRRFPLVFDDPFVQRVRERPHQMLIEQYKNGLKPPAALMHSLRAFLSLAAQHDTPLLAASHDLLDDIDETQDRMIRRQVQATVKVAPTRGPKKKSQADEGNTADSGDVGHMVTVANHLRSLGRRGDGDSVVESSVRRALFAIGLSEWSCVRLGQSKAGACRITLENTPVPDTPTPYDDIRNRTGLSRQPSPQRDSKYKAAVESAHAFSSPSYQHLHQPNEPNVFGMYESQRHASPFSLPLVSPRSGSYSPPPAPRLRCVELPLLDDDLDFEYESPVAECASSLGHVYLDEWSSSLPSAHDSSDSSTELSGVEIETSSASNALQLDLYAASCSTFAPDRVPVLGSGLSIAGNGPRFARALPVSLGIEPSTASLASPLGDGELSDDLGNVIVDFAAPESATRGQSSRAESRVAQGPRISVTDEHGEHHTLVTAPGYPTPIQQRFAAEPGRNSTEDEWASDWDVDMSSAPFEDDLGDDSDDTQRYALSPPSLYGDSDLESDGLSIDSPQESGLLFSGGDPRSKRQGSAAPPFSHIVDDLGDFDDEVLVTPMEEDLPFSLVPVAV